MVLTLSSGNLVEVQQQQKQQQQEKEELEETIVENEDESSSANSDDEEDEDGNVSDSVATGTTTVAATTTSATVTKAVARTTATAVTDDNDNDNGYYHRDQPYQHYYQQQQLSEEQQQQHWLLKKDRIFLLVQFWQQRASLAEKEILSLKEQLNNNTLPKMNNNNNEDHDLKTSASNSDDHRAALDSQLLHKDNEISRLMQEVQRLQSSLTKVQETSRAQIACLEQQLDRCNSQIRRMEARLQLQSDYDEIRKELIRLLKLHKHSDNRAKYKDDENCARDERDEHSTKTIESNTVAIPDAVIVKSSFEEKYSIDRLKTNNNGESDGTNQMLDYYTNKLGDKCKNSDSDNDDNGDNGDEDDDQSIDDQISKIANKVRGRGRREEDAGNEEDGDDDDDDDMLSTSADDNGYRKGNVASAFDTFGSFLGEEIVANWRKSIERSMMMASGAVTTSATSTMTSTTTSAAATAASLKMTAGGCRKKRRLGRLKERRKRIRLAAAGDEDRPVEDVNEQVSDEDNGESDDDDDDDGDGEDADDDADDVDTDDDERMSLDQDGPARGRVPAFLADSLVFGTPGDSKRTGADDLSTVSLQQQQQHHQYYQQQHAALCAAALFRNAAAVSGQKPISSTTTTANPEESATIYHPHATHHPMLDLSHFRSIAAAAAAAAASATAPATTTSGQSLPHHQQQQQQQPLPPPPPPLPHQHHPYRFVDDLGSMVNRLGESLIPKGDPMEARLQEMLRFNMDKYASQNLDTLHISRKVRELLSIHNIGQRLFAKYVLGLSQGTVSELLSKPKPWDKLTEKGRDSYRKMHAWAYDDSAVMLLKSLIPKKGKEPSSVLPFVTTNTPSTSTNTVNNSKTELATGAPSSSSSPTTPKHSEDLSTSDALDVAEHLKRGDEQQQQQQQGGPEGGNEAADDDNNAAATSSSAANDDNTEDISRDKVMKIYQEELTKVLSRKYDEFRGLPSVVGSAGAQGARPLAPTDHFSGLFYPQFLPIDHHHHQQHQHHHHHQQQQQALAHHLRTSGANPDDFRLILDTYNRELNKINVVPNLANFLAFQQQQQQQQQKPPHSAATLMLQQQQQIAMAATVPRNELIQDLSVKKEPVVMTSPSTSSSSSPSLSSPRPQSQPLTNGFSVAATNDTIVTDKETTVPSTSTTLQPNSNAILAPDEPAKSTEQFSSSFVASASASAAIPSSNSSSSSSSIVSPLQRMASITNSLISQPTNQTHSSSTQRPLKAVLPPITQQQFDLYNNLNTEEIVKKVKENLSQYSISQRLFGESVLGLSQGSVSDLLARPKPWHMLTQKGREPFIRMKMFLEDENAVHKLVASQYKIAPEKLMRTGGTYTSAASGVAASAAAAAASSGPGSQSNSTAVAAYAAAVAAATAAAAAASALPKVPSSSAVVSAVPVQATTTAAPSSKLLSPTIAAGASSSSSSAAAAAAASAVFNSFEAYKKLTIADSGSAAGPASTAATAAATTTTSFGAGGGGGGGGSAVAHTSPSVYEMAALTQDLDTQSITTKIKEALLANNIGQKIFGEAVLGLSQGSVSELLSKPKPWHMLSIKGREPFIRMQLWLNDAHNVDRLQALKNQRREATKRRRSFGCMSTGGGTAAGAAGVVGAAAGAGATLANLWPAQASSLSLLNSSVAIMNAAQHQQHHHQHHQQQHSGHVGPSVDSQLIDSMSSIASTPSSPASSILGDDHHHSDFYSVSSPGGHTTTSATPTTASKKQRVLFTTEQKQALRLAFNLDAYPTTATIEFLASELGLSQRTITNWFHNHRMRLKQQNPHQSLDTNNHNQNPQQQQQQHRSQFDPLTFRMLLNQRLLDTTTAASEPSGATTTTKLLPTYLQANPNIALLLSRSLFAAAAANAPGHYPPGGLLAAAAAAAAASVASGPTHGLDLSVKQQQQHGGGGGDDDESSDDNDDLEDGFEDDDDDDEEESTKPTAIELVKVTTSRSRRKPIAPQWVNPEWQEQQGNDPKNIPIVGSDPDTQASGNANSPATPHTEPVAIEDPDDDDDDDDDTTTTSKKTATDESQGPNRLFSNTDK